MKEKTILVDLIMNVRPQELGALIKKLLRIKRKVVELDTYKLWLDPASSFGYTLLKHGTYEPHITKVIKDILKEGDIFVDVGANEGWHSIVASYKVGPNGMVLAIEPQERLWPVIEQNFYLNSMSQSKLAPYAVGEKNETGSIILVPDINTGTSTFIQSLRYSFYKRQEVQVRTLDWIYQQYKFKHVKLMKIDIEGYELIALRSANNLLSAKMVEHIYVDVHSEYLKKIRQTPLEVRNLLKGYGYVEKNFNGVEIYSAL